VRGDVLFGCALCEVCLQEDGNARAGPARSAASSSAANVGKECFELVVAAQFAGPGCLLICVAQLGFSEYGSIEHAGINCACCADISLL
jgi:hypothetical protein